MFSEKTLTATDAKGAKESRIKTMQTIASFASFATFAVKNGRAMKTNVRVLAE